MDIYSEINFDIDANELVEEAEDTVERIVRRTLNSPSGREIIEVVVRDLADDDDTHTDALIQTIRTEVARAQDDMLRLQSFAFRSAVKEAVKGMVDSGFLTVTGTVEVAKGGVETVNPFHAES
jgi:hypothetical protein